MPQSPSQRALLNGNIMNARITRPHLAGCFCELVITCCNKEVTSMFLAIPFPTNFLIIHTLSPNQLYSPRTPHQIPSPQHSIYFPLPCCYFQLISSILAYSTLLGQIMAINARLCADVPPPSPDSTSYSTSLMYMFTFLFLALSTNSYAYGRLAQLIHVVLTIILDCAVFLLSLSGLFQNISTLFTYHVHYPRTISTNNHCIPNLSPVLQNSLGTSKEHGRTLLFWLHNGRPLSAILGKN
jgi:hypothetical protein